MKIIVTCAVCDTQLLVAEGPQLKQSDADMYQQNTSCNTDGQANIQAVLSED